MLRTLLLDDERKSVESLEILLARHVPEVGEVVATTRPDEALDLLKNFRPDLFFLDIEMPQMTGFELLDRLPERPFDVIFTTAFDQYAIRAIRFSALDYLLKPVEPSELKAAVTRCIDRRRFAQPQTEQLENALAAARSGSPRMERIALPTADGARLFELGEIVRCEADRNYTVFHLTRGRRILSAKTLKDYAALLSEQGFVRVHKSDLVNLDFAEGFSPSGFLRLADGNQIEVARRRKSDVEAALASKTLNYGR